MLTPYLKKRIKKILYWRKRKGEISEVDYEYYLEQLDFFPWISTNSEIISPKNSNSNSGIDSDFVQESQINKVKEPLNQVEESINQAEESVFNESVINEDVEPKTAPAVPESKFNESSDLDDPENLDYLDGLDGEGAEEYIEN
jgi:hypothetical protein